MKKQNLYACLSNSEQSFFSGRDDLLPEMMSRVESVFALSWGCQLVKGFDFQKPCPNDLVGKFPDLRVAEECSHFRAKLILRSPDELLKQLDLAYCLHWGIRDALLNGRRPSGKLHPIYVIERRRALQWLLFDEGWDEVHMDT